MRLICGVFHLDGSAAGERLVRDMAGQMDVPRLRPLLRLWNEGPVALAELEFHGGVPERDLPRLGSAVIAADVRLDDPTTLAHLIGANAAAEEGSLVLMALERFTSRGLHTVHGDFAIARWDSATQRLLCARDVFGIRPFA